MDKSKQSKSFKRSTSLGGTRCWSHSQPFLELNYTQPTNGSSFTVLLHFNNLFHFVNYFYYLSKPFFIFVFLFFSLFLLLLLFQKRLQSAVPHYYRHERWHTTDHLVCLNIHCGSHFVGGASGASLLQQQQASPARPFSDRRVVCRAMNGPRSGSRRRAIIPNGDVCPRAFIHRRR